MDDKNLFEYISEFNDDLMELNGEPREKAVINPFETKPDDDEVARVSIFEYIISNIQVLMAFFVIVVLIMSFAVRPAIVSGESMYPTLQPYDCLLLYNFFYNPKQGDIVVIGHKSDWNTPLIKRVIALPGQTVTIDYDTNTVYVDGKPMNEPYINNEETDTMDLNKISFIQVKYPYTVQEGQIFVMGDNRNYSIDSRSNDLGALNQGDILGKPIWRFFRFPDRRAEGESFMGPVK